MAGRRGHPDGEGAVVIGYGPASWEADGGIGGVLWAYCDKGHVE